MSQFAAIAGMLRHAPESRRADTRRFFFFASIIMILFDDPQIAV